MSIQDLNESEVIRQIYLEFGEDEMPESGPQSVTIRYLISVLEVLFRLEGWYIIGNVPIIQPGFPKVAPDVAVYPVRVSRAEHDVLKSWLMAQPNRPAPLMVF